MENTLMDDRPTGPFPKITPDMLNESIRDVKVPDLLLHRPVSKRGFLVPFFVSWVDGDWDFRLIHPQTVVTCLKQRLCWVCGQRMGRLNAFVAGPMCVVTRTSAEPPSHQSCAEYSAMACPFLSNPAMRRNEKGMPEEKNVPGVMIARNPGVAAVLTTTSFRPFPDSDGGMLIQMGEPTQVKWYARRRAATQKEVLDSIESGLPLLIEQCDAEKNELDRRDAHEALGRRLVKTLSWVPRPLPGQEDLLVKREKAGDNPPENTDLVRLAREQKLD